MDRCPNCGSSVRAGAKFCTTCGFRLPQPAAAPEQPTAARRSPFDITSSDTVLSRWTDPTADAGPVEEHSAPAEAASTESAARGSAPPHDEPEAAPEPAAPFSGWPAYGTGFGPRAAAWGTEPKAEEGPLPTYEDVPPVTPESKHTVADAVAAWSLGQDLPAEPAATTDGEQPEEEPAPEPAQPVVTAAGDSADQWAWPPDDAIDAAPAETPEADAEAPEAEAEAAPEIAIGGPAEEAVPETAAPQSDEEPAAAAPVATQEPAGETGGTDEVAPMPTPADTVHVDPAARAAELVAELQALLPELAAKSPDQGIDLESVTGGLAAALEPGAAESESFTSLRAAVATAQARPRDVDVMLDLVGRADALGAVLAAHDRYKQAVEAALKALQGEQDDEPAPRW